MVELSTIYVMLLLYSLQVKFVDSQAIFGGPIPKTLSIDVDRSECGSKRLGISETGIALYYNGEPLTEPYCNITIRKRIVFPSVLLCVGVYQYENVYEMETFYEYNAFFSRKINGYKSTNKTNKVTKRINDYVVKTDKIVEHPSLPIYYACKDGPTEVVISFKENVDKMVYTDIRAKYRERRVKIVIFVVEIDAVQRIEKKGQRENEQRRRNRNNRYEFYYDNLDFKTTGVYWFDAGVTCVPDVLVMVLLLGVALVPL